MKRIGALALFICITTLSLCGCVHVDSNSSVETSIVYVYMDPSENVSEESSAPPTSANSDTAVSNESATESSKSMEPVSLRNLNMFSGSPDINGKEMIATGETYYCIGMTIFDIEAKDTLRRSISYTTKGAYSKFKCTLALMNDKSKNSPLDCFIEVYCDSKLTYTSESISRGVLPIDIETDISGADVIEIKFCVTNNTDKKWEASNWASDQDFFPISFVIAEPEFC